MHSGMTARPETTRSARARRSVEDLWFVGAESRVHFDERASRMRIKLGSCCAVARARFRSTWSSGNIHGMAKM
jgi:hypothetical protein